jgi:peroxiredoxin
MSIALKRVLSRGALLALFGTAFLPGAGLCADNSKATNLSLKDIHGKTHLPLVSDGQKATVFFFILHDCTLCNSYAPEINRLTAEYGPKGIRSYVVYAEAGLSAEGAAKHTKDYGFSCTALLDPKQELSSFTKASVAPGAAIVSPERVVLYRGRIDDRVVSLGKVRAQPRERDLKMSLDSVVEGKPVRNPVTRAIGCYLQTSSDPKSHEK